MKQIACHQYATGRGPSGYGFVAFSKADPKKQEPSYSFSPNKAIGLRFAQLPAGVDYVFEVEPASTDYKHAGAIITRNREEAGSLSVYTHVLITNECPEGAEAFGLLKVDNFLSPDEFSEVTHQTRNLDVVEENCDLSDVETISLNQDQKDRLGEFLARYWALLEQKEWSGKGTPELALLLPRMDQSEMIAFFAKEVVPCLPRFVRPAISVSFGASWNNRGHQPSVCCVLSDNSESPFPCYNLGIGETNFARQVGPVEQEIGRILAQRDPSLYPEAYRRLEAFSSEDDACANLARSFSSMAYCIQLSLSEDMQKKRTAYDKLIEMAEKRYKISKERITDIFFPLIQDIFDLYGLQKRYLPEDVEWMMHQNINLHRSEAQTREAQRIKKNDESLIQGFKNLSLIQMKEILSSMWKELKQENLSSSEIFSLLQNAEYALLNEHIHSSEKQIRSALAQCVRLDREDGKEIRNLADQYKTWLSKEENSSELLQVLCKDDSLLAQNDELYFTLLERIKKQPEKMDAETIAAFLKACKKAESKNPNRAKIMVGEASQSILNGITRLKDISSDSFSMIAETILAQPVTKRNIEKVYDYILLNTKCSEARNFVKKATEKALNAEDINDREYQKVLFDKLEQAMTCEARFNLENEVRRLLEKTNNTICTDIPLKKCEQIKHTRLSESISQFFREISIEPGMEPGKDWDRENAKKYSVSWNDLKVEDMAEPVRSRFLETYEANKNRIELLNGTWSQVQEGKKNAYNTALQNTVMNQVSEDYNDLWQKGNDEDRDTLDKLVMKCSETLDGADIREKCKNTTAGKAREFLLELRNLSYYGMDKAPEKAGDLIRQMKEEKGFNQCIRVDSQMKHQQDDNLYPLVILLLQEIMKSPEGSDYWQVPLTELGYDQNTTALSANGSRMLNILSYILKSLKEMKATEMGEDLRKYLGDRYVDQIWKKSNMDEKWFHGNGGKVLSESLYQWLGK